MKPVSHDPCVCSEGCCRSLRICRLEPRHGFFIAILLAFPWLLDTLGFSTFLTMRLPLRHQQENLSQVAPTVLECQVVHQEAFLLQQVGFELATLAPKDWIDVCRQRCAQRTRPGPSSADTISHCSSSISLCPV